MDCVETCCELLHHGWLMAYAVKQEYLTREMLLDNNAVWRVSQASLLACGEVDTSPFIRALKRVWETNSSDLKGAADMVSKALKAQGVGTACGAKVTEPRVEEALDNVSRGESRGKLNKMTTGLAELVK